MLRDVGPDTGIWAVLQAEHKRWEIVLSKQIY